MVLTTVLVRGGSSGAFVQELSSSPQLSPKLPSIQCQNFSPLLPSLWPWFARLVTYFKPGDAERHPIYLPRLLIHNPQTTARPRRTLGSLVFDASDMSASPRNTAELSLHETSKLAVLW